MGRERDCKAPGRAAAPMSLMALLRHSKIADGLPLSEEERTAPLSPSARNTRTHGAERFTGRARPRGRREPRKRPQACARFPLAAHASSLCAADAAPPRLPDGTGVADHGRN